MKRKIKTSLCAMSLCCTAMGQTASFDALWKQVKQYERQDLPKSAGEVVARIAEKAEREQAKGQQMAALLYGCKLRQSVVPDSFYTDILKLEKLKEQTGDEVRRAVLASVLGELYLDNARRNRNYSDYAEASPDSIREWSYAQFVKASSENFALSMSRPELLADAKAADYMPFVERGKDAAYFGGDLLNVIGRRAMRVRTDEYEPAYTPREVCAKMLAVYRARGNREAELLVTLDSMAFDGTPYFAAAEVRDGGDSPEEIERKTLQSPLYKAYADLLARFGDLPLSAEVYLRMLDLDVTPATKMAWIEEGYGKCKAYPRAKELLNRKKSLEAPYVSLDFPEEVYPGIEREYVVRHRNAAGMTLRWYLLPDGEPASGQLKKEYDKNMAAYARKHGVLKKTDRLDWAALPPYQEAKDTFRLACPGVGFFVVTGKVDGLAASADLKAALHATRFEVVAGDLPDSTSLCTVVDAQSGSPVPDVTVEWYDHDGVLFSAETDGEGKARWDFSRYARDNRSGYVSIRVRKGDDRYKERNGSRLRATFWEDGETYGEVRLYADRAVYRPGQTVYVGGLCWDRKRDEEKVAEGREVRLELRDPNWKTIGEQTVKCDDMGTFSATFVLPAKGLSGRYSVWTGQANVPFSVEEYKRPTFEVGMDEVAEHYRAGDTLHLTGTAMGYNGVPVRHARVTAVSSVYSWFRGNVSAKGEAPIDTVYTDDEGHFTLCVTVIDIKGLDLGFGVRQAVDVSVTSASGETQTARASFPLSKEGLQLSLDAGENWDKDSLPSVTARLRTAAGADVRDAAEVSGDVYRRRDGKRAERVLSGLVLPANKAVRLTQLADLPSGSYELALHAEVKGDTAECTRPFILFSLTDTRPAEGETLWFHCVGDTVAPDSPARLMVGSAAQDVSLFYMLFCRDRVLEEKVFHFSDSILNFTYPEVPDGADGLQAVFYLVKDGRYYGKSQSIVRKRPDRGLRLAWTSFRDRLLPGSEETWRLRVTLPDGRPAPAQLMATLYDASLDGILPHAWVLSHGLPFFLPHVAMRPVWADGSYSMSFHAPVQYYPVKSLSFDVFDPSMLVWRRIYVRGGGQVQYSIASKPEAAFGEKKAEAFMNIEDYEEEVTGSVAMDVTAEGGEVPAEDGGTATRVKVRENLNETAFFYPRLTADTSGVATLSFTLPESLTTWKFIALAHTRDMMTGMLTDEVVAAKDVMAQLALPRFVRTGDRATLSATLFNLTDKPVEGKVTMEVFDPATDGCLWRETKEVKLEAGADTVASFVFTPTGEVSLPACRVLFEAGEHTDGEQRYLPVLEDKEWLTQTLPFVVSQKGETEVRLDGLFQGNHADARHRRLTVEYTANPLWYAVQALPSVLEPGSEDVLSLAACYYASKLSSTLAAQYPQAKTAVEAWGREAGDELKSPLSTQEDLTGIVTEETPWVADAEWQTRQMASLQQLFDANRQADLCRRFAEALGKLQRPDGSFSWFEGMPGSEWLTGGAACLLLWSGAGTKPDSVLTQHVDVRKMMTFLTGKAHEQIDKDKEHLRKHKTHLYGGSYWLSMLYLSTLSDVAWFDETARKDLGYMQGRLLDVVAARKAEAGDKKAGSEDRLSLAETATAVVVLRHMGKPDAAADLSRSLREHLVDGADGLHLEYPSNGFVESSRKIAHQIMLMEALCVPEESNRDERDGLCRWLLSQKRLQAWGTTVGTMEAVHALMRMQKEDLTLRSDDVVRWEDPKGGTLAVLKSAESKWAGLGSVSAAVEGRELSEGAGTLKVEKKTDGTPAWGAAYAQYSLPLSEVGSSAAGMRVRCEVSDDRPKVGDRVTLRYVITSDADYEYVRLKAGRAACLEPAETLSGYEFRNGLGYYKEVKDASTNFFFERLPKGTYVLETECYVERAGRYSLGATKLNGVYAPEFSAYGPGATLEVGR